MPDPRDLAKELARGVTRALAQRGFATLTEFTLAGGRRADVMGLGRGGELVIVEVKSSVADFRADGKWPGYRDWCDSLYFAVAQGFPLELIPDDCGIMMADLFGAAVLREAPPFPLNSTRRRAVTLRFARHAAGRWRRLVDPTIAEPEPG
jgi:hypothetical protein